MRPTNENHILFVGTYTGDSTQGIEVYEVDQTGLLTFKSIQKNIENASYLAISPDKEFLYTANEITDFTDKKDGYISAYKINQKTGGLTFINNMSSQGGAPCYITTSLDGKILLVSNYLGGKVATFMTDNGQIGKPVSIFNQDKEGLKIMAPNMPHMHSIQLNTQNTMAFASDLGNDKIYFYGFDKKTGQLSFSQKSIQLTNGAGPRHFEFSANGRYIYILNEHNSTIEIFNLSTQNRLQIIGTIPKDFSGKNYPADIHFAPSGDYLYATNRGHNSLAIFKVDKKKGTLEFLGTEPVNGDWPRNFMIDPHGKFILVANQKSKNIVSFKIGKGGSLKLIQNTKTVASPACLKVL